MATEKQALVRQRQGLSVSASEHATWSRGVQGQLAICQQMLRQEMAEPELAEWERLLAPYPLSDIQAAFREHLERSPWLPKPAEIIAHCRDLRSQRYQAQKAAEEKARREAIMREVAGIPEAELQTMKREVEQMLLTLAGKQDAKRDKLYPCTAFGAAVFLRRAAETEGIDYAAFELLQDLATELRGDAMPASASLCGRCRASDGWIAVNNAVRRCDHGQPRVIASGKLRSAGA